MPAERRMRVQPRCRFRQHTLTARRLGTTRPRSSTVRQSALRLGAMLGIVSLLSASPFTGSAAALPLRGESLPCVETPCAVEEPGGTVVIATPDGLRALGAATITVPSGGVWGTTVDVGSLDLRVVSGLLAVDLESGEGMAHARPQPLAAPSVWAIGAGDALTLQPGDWLRVETTARLTARSVADGAATASLYRQVPLTASIGPDLSFPLMGPHEYGDI